MPMSPRDARASRGAHRAVRTFALSISLFAFPLYPHVPAARQRCIKSRQNMRRHGHSKTAPYLRYVLIAPCHRVRGIRRRHWGVGNLVFIIYASKAPAAAASSAASPSTAAASRASRAAVATRRALFAAFVAAFAAAFAFERAQAALWGARCRSLN